MSKKINDGLSNYKRYYERKKISDPNYFKRKLKRQYHRRCKEEGEVFRQKYRVINRVYQRSLKGRLIDAKKRAARKGLEFNLSLDEYTRVLSDNCCIYCNGPLPNGGVALDRIDSKKGYIRGNVVACCWPCNSARSDHFSHAEFVAIILVLKRLRKHLPLVWEGYPTSITARKKRR